MAPGALRCRGPDPARILSGSVPSILVRFGFLPLLAFTVLATSAAAQSLPEPAQAYLGDWRIINDETGEAQAIMRIYEADGKVHGRVVQSLASGADPGDPVPCEDCEGEFENADLREIPIIRDMEWEGDAFAGGRIFDPRSGRGYRCVMELQGPSQLRVRGYVGIRALGRTQVWERASAP